MTISRRTCLTAMGIVAAASLPRTAHAFLYGTFVLRCRRCGQQDTVTDGTNQHECERCDTQMIVDRRAPIVCPVGHVTEVDILASRTALSSARCATPGCGRELRR